MPHKDLLEYGIIKHVIKFNVKQKICLFKLSMCKNMIRNTVLENIIKHGQTPKEFRRKDLEEPSNFADSLNMEYLSCILF